MPHLIPPVPALPIIRPSNQKSKILQSSIISRSWRAVVKFCMAEEATMDDVPWCSRGCASRDSFNQAKSVLPLLKKIVTNVVDLCFNDVISI
jgi:hypothetical protein